LAFATVDDIATRLEETSLSATAQASATQLLDEATALIVDAAGKLEADISGTAFEVCKGQTIRLVCRTMASPQGLRSASETLGAYSRTEAYGQEAMSLTKDEELRIRRAVWGSITDSVAIQATQVEEQHDLIYGADEVPAPAVSVGHVANIGADYTATVHVNSVFADTTAGDIAVTLPAANGLGSLASQELFVARSETTSGNTLMVQVQGSDKIRVEGTQLTSVTVISDLFVSNGTDTWEKA
jgi:hypothetical protein